MKQGQQSLIYKLKEQRSARKYLAIAVCLVAILTAFAVFWSLRISGLTLGETATETDATGTDAAATDGEENESDGEIAAANEESGIMLLSSSPSSTQSDDPADYYLAYQPVRNIIRHGQYSG